MYSKIKTIKITPNEEHKWNNLLFNAINASYRQSIPYEYAQIHKGREIETFLFEFDGEDIAGAHYSLKKSYRGIISTADILSGFVFKTEPNAELLKALLAHFIKWANLKNASFARITPWLPKIIAGEEQHCISWFGKTMNLQGFKAIEIGRHTYWIDLSENEEQLLKNLVPQTRNKIRQGERSALTIETQDKPDDNLFELFWSIYNRLGKQKGFYTLSRQQFEQEIISLVERGLANLFFARYNGEVVNVSVAANFGQANYMHGAIVPEFKNLTGCPSPGPYTQWEMIKLMKSKGVKIYDMGFCPGPNPEKDHPQYHIWRFKHGFGGDHVEFLPVYGRALKPIRGRIFQYIRYR